MNKYLQRGVLAVVVVSATTAITHAALPTFWRVSTEAEFLEGEFENLAIDAFGRLTLGPTLTSAFETNAPFLWTLVGAPDGSAYIGSGNEGQVFRVDANGESTVYFDVDELEVHAIALTPDGGLYVGSSPDGKVYKVDGAGSGLLFFDPPDRYIWSLAVDQAGNVFVGTGDKGVIYKVTPDGQGSPFYETKASHAMSLAFDREGRLLAGTESPGRVFRIDASGRPFVLLDSPYREIHMLRVASDGVVYAAAVGARPPAAPERAPAPAPPQPAPTATVTTDVTIVAVAPSVTLAPAATPQAPARTSQTAAAGAIYRILPDGNWDEVWQLREDSPYDLAVEAGGGVLVATGSEGKIYRLSGDPLQPALVARAAAQQVTALLPDSGGRMLLATSNPGKVFRLSPTRADRGTYASDIRDAITVATWGSINWNAFAPAGTSVEISTRSGNTRTPDETWSDWSPVYADRQGSPIASPRARYLQWRAVLTASRTEAPVLTSVTAAYLPRNVRPRVTGITVHPPGTVFQRPFPAGEPEIAGFEGSTPERRAAAAQNPTPGNNPPLGRRTFEQGLLTFVWRAEDVNGDELSYDVLYRGEGEAAWKPLTLGLTNPILVWDTTSVPDGRYLVQVVASDAPSNSPATALTGLLESSAFDIDNRPPEVTVTSVRREGTRTIIAFDVRDASSPIQKAEYSLDGDRWQTVYPRDGIADSRLEQYELTLEGGDAARGVIIRAVDALNNLTSARGEAPAASTPR